MRIYLLVLMFLLTSCNQDDGSGDPTSPNNDKQTIDELRAEVGLSWSSWQPKEHVKHSTLLGASEIVDSESDITCHYIFSKIRYDYVVASFDGEFPEYDVDRHLNIFELGPQTTGSDRECNIMASKSVPFAPLIHALEAIIFLNLDRIEDEESVDSATYHLMDSGDFEAVPVKMTKTSYSIGGDEIGIYILRYKIRGFVNDELQKLMGDKLSLEEKGLFGGEVKGYFTVYLSTKTVPAAWVLSYKYELEIEGEIFTDEYKRVLSINGHKIPFF